MIGSDAAGLRRANGHWKPSGNEDGDQSSALKIPYDMYLFLHRIHAIQVLLPQTPKILACQTCVNETSAELLTVEDTP